MYNIMLAKTLKNVVKLIEKQPTILKFVLYVAIIYGLYHLFLLVALVVNKGLNQEKKHHQVKQDGIIMIETLEDLK